MQVLALTEEVGARRWVIDVVDKVGRRFCLALGASEIWAALRTSLCLTISMRVEFVGSVFN